MGAKPLAAMNIACFPIKEMDIAVLQRTLKGGLDKVREAGALLVGGHSIEDKELKYGLSVSGIVHPQKVLKNSGARAGDKLVLTKPLGTGIVATAIKAGLASPGAEEEITASMARLNKDAAEALAAFSPHACTDVTGFGLTGHIAEMIADRMVGVEIDSSALVLFENLENYCEQGLLPGGLHRNRQHVEHMIEMRGSLPTHLTDALFDAQTSGGLLVSLPADEAPAYLDELGARGESGAAIIGRVTPEPIGKIVVI